jgi:hypothetical protein
MTSTATQPTTRPQRGASGVHTNQHVSAGEWFASGSRRPYDPIAKTMVETAAGEGPYRRCMCSRRSSRRGQLGPTPGG